MPDPTPRRDPAALCAAAVQLRSQGQVTEARRLYEQALLAEPGHFQANFDLAFMDLDAGQLDAAERRSAQGVARQPCC